MCCSLNYYMLRFSVNYNMDIDRWLKKPSRISPGKICLPNSKATKLKRTYIIRHEKRKINVTTCQIKKKLGFERSIYRYRRCRIFGRIRRAQYTGRLKRLSASHGSFIYILYSAYLVFFWMLQLRGKLSLESIESSKRQYKPVVLFVQKRAITHKQVSRNGKQRYTTHAPHIDYAL